MTWDLTAFQSEFCSWANETFPNGTRQSTVAHMREELDEILSAPNGEPLAEECADIVMLALYITSRETGLNLGPVLDRKFRELKTRRWQEPDTNGIVRHVKEESGTK
jgi:hypothetical protein